MSRAATLKTEKTERKTEKRSQPPKNHGARDKDKLTDGADTADTADTAETHPTAQRKNEKENADAAGPRRDDNKHKRNRPDCGRRDKSASRGTEATIETKTEATCAVAPKGGNGGTADEQYMVQRLAGIAELSHTCGVNPYPHVFDRKQSIPNFRSTHADLKGTDAGQVTSTAGRVMAIRQQSRKLIFYTIQGDGAMLQLFCDRRQASPVDNWNVHRFLRLGDQVGVSGFSH